MLAACREEEWPRLSPLPAAAQRHTASDSSGFSRLTGVQTGEEEGDRKGPCHGVPAREAEARRGPERRARARWGWGRGCRGREGRGCGRGVTRDRAGTSLAGGPGEPYRSHCRRRRGPGRCCCSPGCACLGRSSRRLRTPCRRRQPGSCGQGGGTRAAWLAPRHAPARGTPCPASEGTAARARGPDGALRGLLVASGQAAIPSPALPTPLPSSGRGSIALRRRRVSKGQTHHAR